MTSWHASERSSLALGALLGTMRSVTPGSTAQARRQRGSSRSRWKIVGRNGQPGLPKRVKRGPLGKEPHLVQHVARR